MKKNKLFISTLALATATTIVTVPYAEEVAAAGSIDKVIYTVGGQHAEIDFLNVFTPALNAGVLTDLSITYVQLSDGKYYDFGTFTAALNVSSTLDETLDTLQTTEGLSTDLSNVSVGEVDLSTGKIVVGDSPIVEEFKVVEIE